MENMDMPPIANLNKIMPRVVNALQPLYSPDTNVIIKLSQKQGGFKEVLHHYLQPKIKELLELNGLSIENSAVNMIANGTMAEIIDIWTNEYNDIQKSQQQKFLSELN